MPMNMHYPYGYPMPMYYPHNQNQTMSGHPTVAAIKYNEQKRREAENRSAGTDLASAALRRAIKETSELSQILEGHHIDTSNIDKLPKPRMGWNSMAICILTLYQHMSDSDAYLLHHKEKIIYLFIRGALCRGPKKVIDEMMKIMKKGYIPDIEIKEMNKMIEKLTDVGYFATTKDWIVVGDVCDHWQLTGSCKDREKCKMGPHICKKCYEPGHGYIDCPKLPPGTKQILQKRKYNNNNNNYHPYGNRGRGRGRGRGNRYNNHYNQPYQPYQQPNNNNTNQNGQQAQRR